MTAPTTTVTDGLLVDYCFHLPPTPRESRLSRDKSRQTTNRLVFTRRPTAVSLSACLHVPSPHHLTPQIRDYLPIFPNDVVSPDLCCQHSYT